MKKAPLSNIINSLQLIFISTLISGPSNAAQISGVIPGSYDNTIVAFDSNNKIVTGYFSETFLSGTGPLVRCEFYFAGQLTASTAKLKVYQLTLQDEPTSGTLKFEHKGKESNINLVLDEEQPGCMNISPKAELAKTKLAIISATSWIEIRMAAEKKVYFFKSISPDAKTKTYITKGDVVGVMEYKGEWANVVYIVDPRFETAV